MVSDTRFTDVGSTELLTGAPIAMAENGLIVSQSHSILPKMSAFFSMRASHIFGFWLGSNFILVDRVRIANGPLILPYCEGGTQVPFLMASWTNRRCRRRSSKDRRTMIEQMESRRSNVARNVYTVTKGVCLS